MNNFRVIRVDAITGQAVLLYDLVTEDFAWKKVTYLEGLESRKSVRYSWFVVTNIGDWRKVSEQMLKYRRDYITA